MVPTVPIRKITTGLYIGVNPVIMNYTFTKNSANKSFLGIKEWQRFSNQMCEGMS